MPRGVVTARKRLAAILRPWARTRARHPDHWPRTEVARYIGVSPAYLRKIERQGTFPPPDRTDGRLKLWHAATIRAWAAASAPPPRRRLEASLLPAPGAADPGDMLWWRRWNIECGTQLTREDADRISARVRARSGCTTIINGRSAVAPAGSRIP